MLATLKDRFSRFADNEVLFTAENGKDFLEATREARQSIEPDIVLMDIDMPIMNGIKAGAEGYLLKGEPIEKIKEAIDNLQKNEGAPMSPSFARKVLNLLTNAEQPVAQPDKKSSKPTEEKMNPILRTGKLKF